MNKLIFTAITAATIASASINAATSGETDDQRYVYLIKDNKVVHMQPAEEVDFITFELPEGVTIPGKVVFFDDFDQADGKPDPKYWRLSPKGTVAWNTHMSESYDQAYVSDGMLKLVGEKVDGVYKAGGIQSDGRFSFKYGRIDVRARFTKTGQGSWPAIWMMPQTPMWSGWPQCGEIDIMEQLNNDRIVYQTIHSHYRETLGNQSGTVTTPSYNSGEFNTYSLIWTPESLTFLVNDRVTMVYNNLHLADEATKKQWPFDTDFYIILGQQLGGAGTWPGVISDAQLPVMMEIDYVKVTELDTTK